MLVELVVCLLLFCMDCGLDGFGEEEDSLHFNYVFGLGGFGLYRED